jgi:hypothetical protein
MQISVSGSGKYVICAVARRLYLSCTAGAQGGDCFEHYGKTRCEERVECDKELHHQRW